MCETKTPEQMELEFKKSCKRFKFKFCLKGLFISWFVTYINYMLFGINSNSLLFSNLSTPIFIIVFYIYSSFLCKKANTNEKVKEKIMNYKKKKDKE